MSSRFKLLGVHVDALTIEELNSKIKKIVDQASKEIVANHNLHSIYLLKKNSELEKFWKNAYLTHIDGMPLIFWGKFLGYEIDRKHRITYVDLIYPLLEVANNNNWKIFYLGSKPRVAEKAVKKISTIFGNILFKTHHGFFDKTTGSKENKEVVSAINSFNPNLLMVGMGMPRQEKWILENFKLLNANVLLNCGACFDYIAGEQKTPPRIFGKLGLEWFYRFLFNPVRLFRRYFIEPFYLIPYAIQDVKLKITGSK